MPRLEITQEEVEALAWAVWKAAPEAPDELLTTLEGLSSTLLKRRRQIRASRSPGSASWFHSGTQVMRRIFRLALPRSSFQIAEQSGFG